jgi:hypothetical protein
MNAIEQIYSNHSTDYLLYFVVGRSKFSMKLHDIKHSCTYEEAAQAIAAPLQPHDLSHYTLVHSVEMFRQQHKLNSFRVRD